MALRNPPHPPRTVTSTSQFFNLFVELSSPDATSRSNAGTRLVKMLDAGDGLPQADIDYALNRLLKGLCSGRAGARQGYSAGLTLMVSKVGGGPPGLE